MNKDEIIQSIIANRNYTQMMLFSDKPKLHQFVTTGAQMGEKNLNKYIGYCVQIRKGCGQFGSDMVFLRHPDGSLTTHENQCFYSMSEEEEKLARTIFECLPEQEEPELGYICCQKIEEIGFMIENSRSQPSPNVPFMINVHDSNGLVESNIII